jgi:hypothetical protein
MLVHELTGRHFCVSYARPDDIEVCHRIGQSVMLDNGAFSFWRERMEGRAPSLKAHATGNGDWSGYYDWAEEWLDHPTTWAVIPDVIDGSEEENDRLLVSWFQRRLLKGSPVWHLHESLDRLRRLASGYERVCFGSSAAYRTVGSVAWHRRVSEAFDAIADERGRVPWVHMLRGMSLAGGPYPFASADSTDVARNHNRQQNTARAMADRWDAMQTPALWRRVEQLELAP